jgi:hypothetical protein
MKEEAIVATATASRAWQSTSEEKVDVPRFRAVVDRVFTPEALNNLTGKPVRPLNMLAPYLRALD